MPESLPGQHYSLVAQSINQVIVRSYSPIHAQVELSSNTTKNRSKRFKNSNIITSKQELPQDAQFDNLTEDQTEETICSIPTKKSHISPYVVQFAIKLYSKGQMSRILANSPLGSLFKLRGPIGTPFLSSRCDRCWNQLVMIAGGSGITPMIQIIQFHLAHALQPSELLLIYGNRTEKDIVMRNALDSIQTVGVQENEFVRIRVEYVVSENPGHHWSGSVGRIDETLRHFLTWDPRDFIPEDRFSHFALCGPPPMMSAVAKALKDLGYTQNRITEF